MYRWVIGGAFILACIIVWFIMRSGWKRRGKRQAGIARPTLAPADLGAESANRDLFYVATSRAGDPLDRIVVRGLGFRGRAVVSVHPEGVVLDIAGTQPILIERANLREVGRATWTIDRVVEPDGLIQLGWRLGNDDVDTFLRDSDDPRVLVEAIRELIPDTPHQAASPTTTGEMTP
ncbi:MAG: hypothetical protein JWP75_549 [Frondihabitans sp.]|nr:hypothetical protein [Frondihabitans sp.]